MVWPKLYIVREFMDHMIMTTTTVRSGASMKMPKTRTTTVASKTKSSRRFHSPPLHKNWELVPSSKRRRGPTRSGNNCSSSNCSYSSSASSSSSSSSDKDHHRQEQQQQQQQQQQRESHYEDPNNHYHSYTNSTSFIAAMAAATTAFLVSYTIHRNNTNNRLVSHSSKDPFFSVRVTLADAAAQQANNNANTTTTTTNTNNTNCPFYGCPLYPFDLQVLYMDELRKQQQSSSLSDTKTTTTWKQQQPQKDEQAVLLNAYKHVRVRTKKDIQKELQQPKDAPNKNQKRPSPPWWVDPIQTMWTIHGDGTQKPTTANKNNAIPMGGFATLTLTGYKGGSIYNQINQDRAFVIGPYSITNNTKLEQQSHTNEQFGKESNHHHHHTNNNCSRILLGVFDGHAEHGEHVSEYVQKQLPSLLAKNLNEKIKSSLVSTNNDYSSYNCDDDYIVQITKQVLIDTFIELDKKVPGAPSGGCTASVVYKQGNKVYIANTGDSRSFLVTYTKNKKTTNHQAATNIGYISKEHKPDDALEKKRIESMGGTVYIPSSLRGGVSRVIYFDPRTGIRHGLAMSRSIGDWIYNSVGVIPDPTVDVVDIRDILQKQKRKKKKQFVFQNQHNQLLLLLNPNANTNNDDDEEEEEDDVYIFAVSATDGMMDFTNENTIASYLAQSLFDQGQDESDKNAPHLLKACELLIENAANGWHVSKRGRYRDDIAIAVGTLHLPSPTTTKIKTRKTSNNENQPKQEL